jgi:hypothetical protein
MSRKQVVLSVFENEAGADAAVESLMAWDRASHEVRLNAIGILVLDANGDVKTHKLGSRSVGKGGGIGLVLGVLAPPVGVGAVVAGGVLGTLHHKDLGLDEDDRDRMTTELVSGRAAVGVLAKSDEEAGVIAGKLEELGGESEVHDVTDNKLEQALSGPPLPPVTG